MVTVELQSSEDGAERPRQSRALVMGSHVSITSYTTGRRHKGDATGEERCHHQPGVMSCPAKPGTRDLRASGSPGPSTTRQMDLGRGRRGALAL